MNDELIWSGDAPGFSPSALRLKPSTVSGSYAFNNSFTTWLMVWPLACSAKFIFFFFGDLFIEPDEAVGECA